mmetsp:Transcript_32353/g.111397  ORF Transcript_32353/g.111397 Transcript_32353/m.111397 type:complete len:262 (+) Transcript_32353:1963-2748(+)
MRRATLGSARRARRFARRGTVRDLGRRRSAAVGARRFSSAAREDFCGRSVKGGRPQDEAAGSVGQSPRRAREAAGRASRRPRRGGGGRCPAAGEAVCPRGRRGRGVERPRRRFGQRFRGGRAVTRGGMPRFRRRPRGRRRRGEGGGTVRFGGGGAPGRRGGFEGGGPRGRERCGQGFSGEEGEPRCLRKARRGAGAAGRCRRRGAAERRSAGQKRPSAGPGQGGRGSGFHRVEGGHRVARRGALRLLGQVGLGRGGPRRFG